MARQTFISTETRSGAPDTPPDAAKIISNQLLFPWMRANGPLPAPCPYRADDCAAWWLQVMQEPERRGETTQAPMNDGKMRWDCGYAVSRMDALRAFLDMTESQRNAVVAGVVDERVPYRGDPIGQYIEIIGETLKMREDPEAYKREAISRAKAAIASFGKG